jgi:sulfur carrier protein ThiS
MKYDKYIGLPYKEKGRDITGVDCWGLVCLYYRDELGIELPSYQEEYNSPDDPNVIRAISLYKDSWELTTTPSEGDVVLFNIYGEPRHIGVYLGNNRFIHSREGSDSVIDSIASPRWASRIEGTYKYSEHNNIQVVGAPHPLKTQIIHEWTVEGTTVQDFVNFTKEKYKVSPAFGSQLIVAVDGIPVPQSEWETTVLKRGQVLAYKSVPEGGNTLRLIAMFAVIIFAPELSEFILPAGEWVPVWATRALTVAISVAGMALVDAIFPIREDPVNNPGTPGQMNLFTGGQNQANRFGSIPVVLGRMRSTGPLGAVPYVQTAPDTNLLNLLVVWGFGPLQVDNLCIGSTPIKDYYIDNIGPDIPTYKTLYGVPGENDEQFNRLYPSDVQQINKGVELVNNVLTGYNPWVEVPFTQTGTSVEISFTFPEGMRSVNTKNGDVGIAQADIYVQLGRWNGTGYDWSDNSPTSLFNSTTSGSMANTWTTELPLAAIPSQYYDTAAQELYQYHTIALVPGNGIQVYHGAATEQLGQNPSSALQSRYKEGSYNTLVNPDTPTDYNYLPQVPPGAYKLYTIVIYGGTYLASSTIDHRSIYSSQGLQVTGLALSPTPYSVTATNITYYDNVPTSEEIATGTTRVSITAGSIRPGTQDNPLTPITEQTVCTSLDFVTGDYARAGSHNFWSSIINDYGIWKSSASTTTWSVPKVFGADKFQWSGWYSIEASADDQGTISIDGAVVATMPYAGGGSSVKNWVYLERGTHTVTVTAVNSGQNISGDVRGVGFKINYFPGGLNPQSSWSTTFQFGVGGFYEKRKDPFNFSYRFTDLDKDPQRYAIRAKRVNLDTAEITEGDNTVHYYYKVILSSASSFSNNNPVVNPPNCYLAKTAVRVQSTNKANGQIDGINAIVQTIGYDWIGGKWVAGKPINNPASLLLYVLTHPANAYKLNQTEAGINSSGVGHGTKINWAKLQEWHEFCSSGNPSGGKLSYNSIITSTISIMDIMRDICAAGMASPQYSDGKWTVIIDKPRDHTTQYFTTYNSWGFSATKALPRLPHAFRITIPDETIAYQANEFYVYNYGYNADGSGGKIKATLFEQLQLPGITNQQQATFMARWHLAQLTLRPETYSLNTDFEHLVCQRGDVVKVTHDVPQWGVGSGRIKNPQVGSNTLVLTERLWLTAGKQYQILIRTNNQSQPDGITKNIAAITTTGWYDTVNIVTVSGGTTTATISSSDGLADDNLFLFGELNKVSQQLVVISIEPGENATAKLTLVDYSPQIYTSDLTQLLIYDANITPISTPVIQNTINSAPIIVDVTSDSAVSEQISNGIYKNVAIISFANPAELTRNAEIVQFQVVDGTASIDSTSLNNLYYVNKEQGSIIINDLITGKIYKVRARYANQMGTISGPWSDVYTFTNIGKDTNYFSATGLYLDLDDVYLVATPVNITKPSDFDHWEFKIYKDTGSADFWDTTTTLTDGILNIQTVTGYDSGRFDLRNQHKPIISTSGVEYRVACRAVDRNGNYSDTSTLNSILVKTIQ